MKAKDLDLISGTDIVKENYWSAPSENYGGSYGNYEHQYGLANFIQVGDVGDSDWRDARRLPFGDEALEALYPGSRGLIFLQYPWEHPDADDAIENPVERAIARDPALDWALQEMSALEPGSERYSELSALVAEIRDYERKQVETEGFIHAPEWAMEAILYSQEVSFDNDATRIIEDFEPRRASVARVISSSPYSDSNTLMIATNRHYEYEIKSKSNSRDWCFAIREGEKVFGPYGKPSGVLKLYRGPASYTSFKDYKRGELYKVLISCGIQPVFDGDGNLSAISHDDVNIENLQEAKEAYNKLAEVIQESNSTASMIINHINDLSEDNYWDRLSAYTKRTLINSDDSSGSCYKSLNDLLLGWLKEEYSYNFSSLREAGHEKLSAVYVEYDDLRMDLLQKDNTRYYVLKAGKDTTVSITSSKEEADAFRTGDANELLYWLMDPRWKRKNGRLDTVRSEYGLGSEEEREWISKANRSLHTDICRFKPQDGHISPVVQSIVSEYISFRKVKTVSSRNQRSYGWLLQEIPFGRPEIKVMSDCLEAYGRAIVKAQQTTPVVKRIFGRLQSVILHLIKNSKLPTYAINQIRENGSLSFIYNIKHSLVENDLHAQQLKADNLASDVEIRSGKYVNISIAFDYDLESPSDVFRYVRNFNVDPSTIKLLS